MRIQQISVFLENRHGALAEMLGVLKENGINLRALSLADTSDFGIMRLVVNEPKKLEQVMKDAGLTVKSTQVLTALVPDSPGGLFDVISKLSSNGINVEYIYAFSGGSENSARVVLKVDDLDKAERLIHGEARRVDTDDIETPEFYW